MDVRTLESMNVRAVGAQDGDGNVDGEVVSEGR